MLSLPAPRHAVLKSFWLVITSSGGLLASSILFFIHPTLSLAGLILAFVLATAGMRRTRMRYIAYRIWNVLVNQLAHYARIVVLGICFYLIFVAVGQSGSSLRLGRPSSAESLWVRRETIPTAAYGSQSRVSGGDCARKGWITSFVSWARQSGNLWACCLLPFLLLLSALNTCEESKLPDDSIYTLF